MRPSQLLAPLVVSSLTLACGSKDPAPAPAPTAAPAPTPSPEPAPTPASADAAAPAPAPDAAAPTPAPDAAAPTPVPTATTCTNDHATFLDTAGTIVPTYAAAVGHAVKAQIADDAAAKAALADTYAVFLDTPDALVTHIEKGDVQNATTNLYARLSGDKGFGVFAGFHDKLAEHLDVKASPATDRYLVVAVVEEYHERVPACLNDEVDEEDCEGTATGDAGGAYNYYVVDRDAGRLLFSYGHGRDADQTCEGAKAPTLEGDTWTAYNCNGSPETFTVAAITPCTRAFHEKRMADERAAEEKKRAEDEAAAAAKRLPAADVETLVNEGRKLTTAKDYAGAIAVFDKVLATNPDAVRAHTGRAFALLQRAEGDDLVHAETGFDAAYQLTKSGERDEKLRSQIMFNRGLIAEKQGKADQAKRFFQKAHDLSPSPATEKKLAE